MKKIAMLNDFPFNLAYGGKEIQMVSYMKHLNDRYYNNVNITLLDFWNKNYLEEIDILHLFGYSNWYFDLVKTLRSNHNKKVVISPTFYYKNEGRMRIASHISKLIPLPNFFSYKREIMDLSDKIIVNSIAERSQLINLFGKRLYQKIEIIHNAVEKNFIEFSSEGNIDSFLKEYNLEPGYLLSVSFLDERKNNLNLLKAITNIKDKLRRKLVLIGGFRFRNKKNLVDVLRILEENKNDIIHIPYIDRRSELLKSAYYHCVAHLLPSYLETPGISNLEALYFGKPILVGDCAPVREYFDGNALFVNPGSINSIQKGIIEIVKQSVDLNKRRNLVYERYLLEDVVPRIYSIYEGL